MIDKFSNILIVLIIITIIILGGVYAYKVVNDKGFVVSSQEITTREETVITPTREVVQDNVEEQNLQSSIPIISVPTKENKNNVVQENTELYGYNNRYYYNQLDNYSKAIYDTLINNKEKLILGNEIINIDYDFSEILRKDGENQQINKYYDDAINALNLDVPNLFYIDFSKMYLNIETTTSIFSTKYKLYLSPGKNINYYSGNFSSKEEVTEAIDKVEELKNYGKKLATGSDYNKIKLVHDWLIDYLSYDMESVNRGTVYGALVEKRAVCEGYARTIKNILDELGIENVLIVGTATNSTGETEDHMWNYVKINNIWYAVDSTWDDPIVHGGGKLSYEAKHEYFLIGSEELFKNHVERGTISSSGKVFELPTLSQYKY